MKSSYDRGHCNSRSSNGNDSCRDSKKGGLHSVLELCVCVCVCVVCLYVCVVCVCCVLCVCVRGLRDQG